MSAGTARPPAGADFVRTFLGALGLGETARPRATSESRGNWRRVGLEHRIDDVARDARRRRVEQRLQRSGSRQDLATYRLEERRRDDVRALSDRLDYPRPSMRSATWSEMALSEQLERVRDQIELERRTREIDHRMRARAEAGRAVP